MLVCGNIRPVAISTLQFSSEREMERILGPRAPYFLLNLPRFLRMADNVFLAKLHLLFVLLSLKKEIAWTASAVVEQQEWRISLVVSVRGLVVQLFDQVQ